MTVPVTPVPPSPGVPPPGDPVTGASRRTIYYWITKGWVDVRYTPSGKARVVVSTLQQRGAA